MESRNSNGLNWKTRRSTLRWALGTLVAAGWVLPVLAQGPPPGRGPNQPEMRTIHALFADTSKVQRRVQEIPGGIEAFTESKDPKVVALLQEHVAAMKRRLESGARIRMWDPLYRVLFDHADKIKMHWETTPNGVKVVETSDDPYVVRLIREHGKAVSGFVKEGIDGMHREHPAPPRTSAPAKKTVKPDRAGHDHAGAGKGDGVSTCPVTGEAVDPSVATFWQGKVVSFCCVSCRKAFRQNPSLFTNRLR